MKKTSQKMTANQVKSRDVPELTTFKLNYQQPILQTSTPLDINITKIIQSSINFVNNNMNLQAINLLRSIQHYQNHLRIKLIIQINLGLCYYHIGLIQQCYQSLKYAISIINEIKNKLQNDKNKNKTKLCYQMYYGQLYLQICILFSQMGKHQLALDQARQCCQINFNSIYNILIFLYETNENQKDSVLNMIAVLQRLLIACQDLRVNFANTKIINKYEQIKQNNTKKDQITQANINKLYIETNDEIEWIYQNKILDQIQLSLLSSNAFTTTTVNYNKIIQCIVTLIISLYCYSTETRFIEKDKQNNFYEVLDSQHWLSRALEIAYIFLPAQAPVLNQILTVHSRFHSLDKQTIPENQQVTGYYKVLKPLSKPKSNYFSKNILCSPLMIRIQAPKITIDIDKRNKSNLKKYYQQEKEIKEQSQEKNVYQQQHQTIDINTITRNNKIRGLNEGLKIIDFGNLQHNKNIHLNSVNNYQNKGYSNPTLKITQVNNGKITSQKIHRQFDEMKINLNQVKGKAIMSRDKGYRPHSYGKNPNYLNEQIRTLNSQRKKKTSVNFKRESKTHRNFSNTFDRQQQLSPEFHLAGHRLDENIQNEVNQKTHNDNRIFEATKMGGNVYINNNINLFISKDEQMNSILPAKIHKNNHKNKTTLKQFHQISNTKSSTIMQGEGLTGRNRFSKRRTSHLIVCPEDF